MTERAVSLKTSASWLKRAETIQRKIELLQSDMIGALGVDHYLTDEGDDVIVAAGNLCFALSRYPLPSDKEGCEANFLAYSPGQQP